MTKMQFTIYHQPVCEIKQTFKNGAETDYKSQCKEQTACFQQTDDTMGVEKCTPTGANDNCYTCLWDGDSTRGDCRPGM